MLIIGESLFVEKVSGDVVYVGMINELGLFDYCVMVVVVNLMFVWIIYVVEEV